MSVYKLRQLATFRSRLRGCLGRSKLGDAEVLHLIPCRAIHTIGLRFPLTIIFLDRQHRVLRFIAYLPPRRIAFHPAAYSVIELSPGRIHSEKEAEVLVRQLFQAP